MLFTLEALRAAEGDCLLLHWGTIADPRLALIDGGPGRTYEERLRPRLEEIAANRGLAQLRIDLAMVSHVDTDHIIGVRKLLVALKREIENQTPIAGRLLTVKRLWHNTFNDILDDAIDQFFQTLTASFTASVAGQPNPAIVSGLATELAKKPGVTAAQAAEAAFDISKVLAAHPDGRTLRDTHKFLFEKNAITTLNHPFKKNGKPTLITTAAGPVDVDGLSVRIVGPQQAEIEALQTDFDKFIKKKGLTASTVLAGLADDSVTNLSSIVCLTELGGQSILLTGDALGENIVDALTTAGLAGATPLKVNILKMPHHGSVRNIDAGFFTNIVADTYVFSGDGKHANPDRETLELLVASRPKTDQYTIVLTYGVDETDVERKKHFDQNGIPFSQANDSLKAFFESTTAGGFKFTLVAGAPHKMELGDEHVPW